MKTPSILLVILLVAAAAFGGAIYATKSSGESAKKETAFERVMRTGTLRCGYLIYPQFMDRDPNTGSFSGIAYDLMNEVGRQLDLKIEWAEEVGIGNIFEGLNLGRYDAVCSGIVVIPHRLKVSEFTSPYLYLPYFMYAKAGDTRFDENREKANDPSVKIAYLEGELGQTIREQDFPQSSSLSLQNLTGFSEVPLQVATGKADLFMGEPAEVDLFIAKNPDKIRQLPGPPMRVNASCLQVGLGEHDLRNLLDGALFSLQNTGFIPKLLEKHLGKPGHYYFLPAQTWRVQER